MKKIISLMLLSLILSGCSLFRIHKQNVEQGNVIDATAVKRLHKGMSESQVKQIMGNPIMSNIFTPTRIEYVYTYQEGYERMHEKRVVCIFNKGLLTEILEI